MKTANCLFFFGLLLVCLISCNKEMIPRPNGTGATDTIKISLKTDVYYVGFINEYVSAEQNRAEFGKNGVLTPLSKVTSGASHIWVSKGNTYVCGYEGESSHAVYWKNLTSRILLTNGNEYYSIANDITVQNSDVLCVGNLNDQTGYNAVFWRNGKMTVLSNNGTATRILVKGNDIYITGTYVDAKGNYLACYWKNGIVHNLTARAQATGIAIDDNSNIYVSGTLDDSPVYWKNDVMTALPKTTMMAYANAITTQGNDVYIVGSGEDDPYWGYDQAYCWKNGVPQDFPGGAAANDIITVGTHIFIAGSHALDINNYGRLWEDTSIAYLDPDDLNSVFTGMYIDQHY